MPLRQSQIGKNPEKQRQLLAHRRKWEARPGEKCDDALTVRKESSFPRIKRAPIRHANSSSNTKSRKPMGNSTKSRKRGKSGWRIVIAVIAVALLACGLLITLDVRKVAVEKKVDQKAAQEKTMSNVAPSLPVQPQQPDNN
jgi:uncharacterized protein HemX